MCCESKARHGVWHAPCKLQGCTPPGIRQKLGGTSSQGENRNEEEPEGFLTYRIADRRGDHFDHRGYRDPELAPRSDGGARIFGGRLGSHDRYLAGYVPVHLGYRLRERLDDSGNAGCRLHRGFVHERLLDRPGSDDRYQERLDRKSTRLNSSHMSIS